MGAYPKKSLAAVLTAYQKPVEIRELDVPPIDAQSILVKVEAGTVCGTDVHIWHGHIQQYSRIPLVMGHEAMGTIAALGWRSTERQLKVWGLHLIYYLITSRQL